VLVIGQSTSLAPALGGRTTFTERLRVVGGAHFQVLLSRENGNLTLRLANPTSTFIYEYTSGLFPSEWRELVPAYDGSPVLPATLGVVFIRAVSR
jgi:hypothetical protein